MSEHETPQLGESDQSARILRIEDDLNSISVHGTEPAQTSDWNSLASHHLVGKSFTVHEVPVVEFEGHETPDQRDGFGDALGA